MQIYHDTAVLAAAVQTMANWSTTSLPRANSADQAIRLLNNIDRITTMGHRDYAIALLLARLGLHSSGTMFLVLDELDWASRTLHLRTKGGERNALP